METLRCDFCGKKGAKKYRYAEEDHAYYEPAPRGIMVESDGGEVYACGTRHLNAYLKDFLSRLEENEDGTPRFVPLTSSELKEVVIWEDHEQ